MTQRIHGDRDRGISRSTWVLIGFLAVAAYFLLSEHQAHFIRFLPFLLLAACPLMHLFHSHGRHDRGDAEERGAQRRPRSEGDSQ
jgi:hypothetical protein